MAAKCAIDSQPLPGYKKKSFFSFFRKGGGGVLEKKSGTVSFLFANMSSNCFLVYGLN